MKTYLSEGLGTFALVFAGTGAVIANGLSDGAVSHVGIALTFGLVVLAMVYALGDVSGAHINPAVTLGLWLARRFPGEKVGPYIASQAIGAILASVLLRFMFGTEHGLGATAPSGSALQSLLMEIVVTCILVLVILCVTTGAKEKGITAAIAIGSVVGFEVLFAGPVSGASMNPARSLGPAVAGLEFGSLWVYIVAPVVGAGLAVVFAALLHPAETPAALDVEQVEAEA